MMTTMVRQTESTVKASKPRKPKAIKQAKIHYDFNRKMVAIQHQDETGAYSSAEYLPRFALRNVVVTVEQGKRDGCNSIANSLGFLHGEVIPEGKGKMPFSSATIIKWNGSSFRTDDNREVKVLDEVYVIGSTMLGYGIK